MNQQEDPHHVRRLKQKIAGLREEEHLLKWRLERTVQELNKAKERHARYVASRPLEFTDP